MSGSRETGAADTGGFSSRVSWGSILLGVVVALGIMLLLTLLGIALGFSLIDPGHEANPLAGIPIGTAIYFNIAHIVALAIGGYAAARLTSSAWSSAAVLHGAAVWALVALVTTTAALAGAGALVSGTISLVSTISGGAASAARALVPDNVDLPDFRDIETLIPNDFMASLPSEIQESLQQRNLTLADIRREGKVVIRQVISQQEQQRAGQAVIDAVAGVIRNPAQASQQIQQLSRELFGDSGLFSRQDRQEAARLLQDRLGISPQEAQAVVDQWQQRTDEVSRAVQNALDDIQKQAAQVAERVTGAIATAAWWMFVISLLALLAAVGGAVLGRPKRH